ncbi:hypothetical protein LUZ61_016246 [Rhynchospora tenuis]|uniref:Reverse transcriptase domain-containing protein n=1 Tax=Rhynchospora tenuis TaxID=198213 RepID=A0AAD5Z550_9POAL|nr:hypothetical protein LUZ61_016246 [Rhynchospora tenuis]
MSAFNELIEDLQLFDVPLSNRRYTWSNKQPNPILSRLDRFLISPDWFGEHPKIVLHALPTVVSDHCPLLLRCSNFPTQSRTPKLEKFWFQNENFTTITNAIWASSCQSPCSISSFTGRLDAFHKELKIWSKAEFNKPNLTLLNAKRLIFLLDQIEESRPLTSLEVILRIKLREKAFDIANILEIKWHQRSRTRWLKCGDLNTSYFHAMASTKQRNKYVSSLLVGGRTVSSPTEITAAFSSFFQTLIGTEVPCLAYSCNTLYSQSSQIFTLDDPFTEQEVHHAVMKLADNKASGPDGIPNEFCKIHWNIMKPTLMSIFEELYTGKLQLEKINFAHVILLPKIEGAQSMNDFRPISIINYVPKIISKVLALRLQPFLPSLISPSQTGFLKGRLIYENFIVARELTNHINSDKIPAVLLKLDFYKAFDSVSWDFLFSILLTRGFPPKFISWIKLSLTTATSAILVNGVIGPTFNHKKGLRQGDPISPFLFLLAADVLSRMLQATAMTLNTSISHKVATPFFLLQYADDTLIFTSAEGHTLRALHLTLQLFQNASGLKVNAAKSSFIPCNVSEDACTLFSQLFGYQRAEFPLQYLGLPLTSARPNRVCFQPLLDKIQNKLAGWKGKLLSRAGRLVLVSSVLSSIPSYVMSTFLLPNWLLNEIDKARKRFLWGTNQSGGQRIHQIAWNRICLPRAFGGLGLLDFRLHNRALLLRWIWKLYAFHDSLWFSIASKLFCPQRGCKSPSLWLQDGSFFWRDIRSLFHLFQLSTKMQVQNGVATSFWFDNWGGQPLYFLKKRSLRPPRSRLCLKDGLLHATEILPTPHQLEVHSVLSMAPTTLSSHGTDTIQWRWTYDGKFSVASAYKCWISAGKLISAFIWIWKLKVPPTLKLFLYLLSNDRLLTKDQLGKRGLQTQPGCVLCDSAIVLENTFHLFFECPFTIHLQRTLHCLHQTPAPTPASCVSEALLQMFKSTALNNFQQTLLATHLYAVWLERNNRTFRSSTRPIQVLAQWIALEAESYCKCC